MSRANNLHLLPPVATAEPYLTIVDTASSADRLYFEQHPTETRYVRKAIPGELGPPMDIYHGALVIVIQLRPGARIRRLVQAGGVQTA